MSPKDIEEQFAESLNNAFKDGVIYALKHLVRAAARTRASDSGSVYHAVAEHAQQIRKAMATYQRRPMCFNCAGYLQAKEVERTGFVCTACNMLAVSSKEPLEPGEKPGISNDGNQ